MAVLPRQVLWVALCAILFCSFYPALSHAGVVVSPKSLSFPNQAVGSVSPVQSFTVSNNQKKALSIKKISFTAKLAGDYHATSNCPIGVGKLAKFGSCTFNITFTPTGTGDQPGSLVVFYNPPKKSQTVTLDGTGLSLAISSVSNTSPLPLTPIQIFTTGLDQNTPVSVQFSNGAGFSTTEAPIRIDSSGTVVAAVPLFSDQVTGQTSAGTVSLTLSQGTPSNAVAINIQDLPPLSTYGTQLGRISHVFAAFEAMQLQGNLNQLQAAQPLLTLLATGVDTSAAQSTLSNLLLGAIEARDDIDLVMANNSFVISWGAVSGGAPIQFDSTSLDAMDRVLGLYLLQQFSGLVGATPPLIALPSIGLQMPPMQAASAATVMGDLLTKLGQEVAVDSADEYLQELPPVGTDASVSALGGLAEYAAPTIAITGHSLGIVTGLELFQTGLDNMFNSTIASADCNAFGCSQANVDAILANLNGSAAQLFSGDFQAISHVGALSEILQGTLKTGSGLLSLLETLNTESASGGIDNADKTARDLVTSGDLKQIFTLPNHGMGKVNAGANISQPQGGPQIQSSLDYCCVAGSTGIDGVCDLSGNCSIWVPLGVPGTNYSNQTLSVFDPISGLTLGSEVVNLTGLNSGTPVLVPTIQGTCNDTDSGAPDGDDPDCD